MGGTRGSARGPACRHAACKCPSTYRTRPRWVPTPPTTSGNRRRRNSSPWRSVRWSRTRCTRRRPPLPGRRRAAGPRRNNPGSTSPPANPRRCRCTPTPSTARPRTPCLARRRRCTKSRGPRQRPCRASPPRAPSPRGQRRRSRRCRARTTTTTPPRSRPSATCVPNPKPGTAALFL